MSKQTTFYMMPDEEQIFLDMIRKERDLKVISYRNATSDIKLYDSFPVGIPLAGYCYLWDTQNSPPPVIKYIATQGYYLVDDKASELILFNRTQCFEKKKKIEHGRIFIDNKLWHDDVLVERPKAFLQWYEKLAKWIRKNGLYRADLGYVYPEMKQFLDENPEYSLG